ncbi:MAG: hypothetical protein QF491_18025, partial [Alphaproteobacteria bacterium]|nr:hypothetical protein [Alphaproteobacteria bacterium]
MKDLEFRFQPLDGRPNRGVQQTAPEPAANIDIRLVKSTAKTRRPLVARGTTGRPPFDTVDAAPGPALTCVERSACKSFGYNTESQMADDLDAKARLEEAVGRLEGALGGIVERANASGGDIDKLSRRVGDLESELTSLRDERDRLAGELDASRAGQSSMQEA